MKLSKIFILITAFSLSTNAQIVLQTSLYKLQLPKKIHLNLVSKTDDISQDCEDFKKIDWQSVQLEDLSLAREIPIKGSMKKNYEARFQISGLNQLFENAKNKNSVYLYYPSHFWIDLNLKNNQNLAVHIDSPEALVNLIKQKGLSLAEFAIDLENEEIVVNQRDLACDLIAKNVSLRFDSDALIRLSESDILAINKYHSAIEKIVLNLPLLDLKSENQRINSIELGYGLFDLFEQFYIEDTVKAINAQFLLNRLFEPDSFKFTLLWQKKLEKWQINYAKQLNTLVKNIEMQVP